MRLSEAQRAQLALALRIKTSIYVVSHKEPIWKRMELKGLVAQMPSGNWLLTPLGWDVLKRKDEHCEHIPTKSLLCSSTPTNLFCLCSYDNAARRTMKPRVVRCWYKNLWPRRCKVNKYKPIVGR